MAERNVYKILFMNFINSLKPRQIKGNNMGKDYIGNVYYEIPANPSIGKRKSTRWYEPSKGKDFENPLPAEWESWLRNRRKDIPTEEEITKNLAIMKMKKMNADKLEEKRLADGGSLPTVQKKGMESYPSYSEYHLGSSSKE